MSKSLIPEDVLKSFKDGNIPDEGKFQAALNRLSDPEEYKKEFEPIEDENIQVELWVLVDSSARIYYTGFSEQSVTDYRDSNFFKDLEIVKLIGQLASEGTKND